MQIKHLLIVFIVLTHFLLTGQSDCLTGFSSTYGRDAVDEFGYSVAIDPIEKCYYLGGSAEDYSMLLKIDTSGKVVWSKKLDLVSNRNENLVAILLDKDRNLILCGHADGLITGGNLYVAKFNPSTENLIWSHTLQTNWSRTYLDDVLELDDNTILISSNPHNPPNNNNNAELIKLNHDTGLPVTGTTTQINVQSSEFLTELILHEGSLYGCGRFTLGDSPEFMRNIVTKLDPVTFDIEWLIFGIEPPEKHARIYGYDMVLKSDFLYSTIVANRNGASINQLEIFVQKTSITDGTPIWVRNYDIPGNADYASEIIIHNGRMFIMANQRVNPNSFFLFEIDENGNVVWAKEYSLPNHGSFRINNFGQNTFEAKGDELAILTSAANQTGDYDMMFIRTDLNGNPKSSCALVNNIHIPSEIKPVTIYPGSASRSTYLIDVLNSPPTNVEGIEIESRDSCYFRAQIEIDIDSSICSGAFAYGYNTNGLYSVFRPGTGYECDTIINLALTVLPGYRDTVRIDVCRGSAYQNIEIDTSLIDSFVSISNCDSIVVSLVRFYDFIEDREVTICKGLDYYNHTTSGFYVDTIPGEFGTCDTILNLNLIVEEPEIISKTIELCYGETYNGKSESEMYYDTIYTPGFCDSIYLIDLVFSPLINTVLVRDDCEFIYMNERPPGTYVIDTLTSEKGCDSLISTTIVDSGIYIPNVFSPNNDGINDTFMPFIECTFNYYTFQIFDRWGNMVYSTQDPEGFWDGNFKEKQMGVGVFVYVIKIGSSSIHNVLLKGDVTLVR